jgi:hypothetical protein
MDNPFFRGLADKRKVKSVDAVFPVEACYKLFENPSKTEILERRL